MSRKPTPGALVPVSGIKGGLVVYKPAEEAAGGLLSSNTKLAYIRDWKDFFKVDDLSKVTPEMALATTTADVAAFRDGLIAQGMKPSSISRKLSSVRAFFNDLMLRGKIQINPAHPKLVRPPKRGNVRKMEALTPEEAKTFLRTIDRTTPLGRRDYALIMADLHLGLRRSEVCSLKTDQFKTASDRAYIIFRSKGEKERFVNINRDLEEALRVYYKDRGGEPGYIFPGQAENTHLTPDFFWKIVQKYLGLAGIKKKVGTHGLRATFITVNIEKGTPLDQIQKTVGHTNADTTLGYARDMEMIKSRAPKAMEGLNAD